MITVHWIEVELQEQQPNKSLDCIVLIRNINFEKVLVNILALPRVLKIKKVKKRVESGKISYYEP